MTSRRHEADRLVVVSLLMIANEIPCTTPRTMNLYRIIRDRSTISIIHRALPVPIVIINIFHSKLETGEIEVEGILTNKQTESEIEERGRELTKELIETKTGTAGEPIGAEHGVEVMTPTTKVQVQKEAGGILILVDQGVTVAAPEREIPEAIIVAILVMDTVRQRSIHILTHADLQETVHRQVKPTCLKRYGVAMQESIIVGGRLVADREGTRNSFMIGIDQYLHRPITMLSISFFI